MGAEVTRSRAAAIAEAAELLAAGGVPEPRREAFRLWREVAGDSTEAVVRPQVMVEETLGLRLREAAARRARGEPLAHVSGRIGFRHLVLRSDRRALIPRPETEGLVERLLERVAIGRAADIGTGTGAIALSLAQEGRFDLVLGVDLSVEALELARENRGAAALPLSLLRGDLCGPIADASLDALVSNPPYLSAQEYASLDPAVRAWEPEAALVSGEDGLDATHRLLDDGRRVLRAGGWLAIEVDCTRARASARRAAELGWDAVAIHADLYGRERYLLAQRSATR